MSKRKSDHCIIRNGKMFCSHCGQYQELPMPMRVEMFTAMAKTFCKIHKDCEPTWKEPEVDQSLSERNKEEFELPTITIRPLE